MSAGVTGRRFYRSFWGPSRCRPAEHGGPTDLSEPGGLCSSETNAPRRAASRTAAKTGGARHALNKPARESNSWATDRAAVARRARDGQDSAKPSPTHASNPASTLPVHCHDQILVPLHRPLLARHRVRVLRL